MTAPADRKPNKPGRRGTGTPGGSPKAAPKRRKRSTRPVTPRKSPLAVRTIKHVQAAKTVPHTSPDRLSLSVTSAFRRSLAVMDGPTGRDICARVDQRLAHLTGPTCQITYRIFFTLCLTNAAMLDVPQMRSVLKTTLRLPVSTLIEHNILERRTHASGSGKHRFHGKMITHRQLDLMFQAIARSFRDETRHDHCYADPNTGEVHLADLPWIPDERPHPNAEFYKQRMAANAERAAADPNVPVDCTRTCPARQTIQWLNDRLMDAAYEVTGLPEDTLFALDSTHQESHFRRRSWGRTSDADLDSLEAITLDMGGDLSVIDQIRSADYNGPIEPTINPDTSPDPAAGLPPGAALTGKAKKTAEKKAAAKTATAARPDRTRPNRFRDNEARERARQIHAAWTAQQLANPQSSPSSGRIDPRTRVYGPTAPGDDFTVIEQGWPRLRPDGRLQITVDPDVTEGWHSGQNGARASTAAQRDLHTLNHSGFTDDGHPLPGWVRRYRLMGGGTHKGDAAVDLLTDFVEDGYLITDLQVDRGYTITDPARFADPVRALGINAWLDLMPWQKGQAKDSYDNVLIIDGGFFASSTPTSMRNLAYPDKPGTQQRDDAEKQFNYRAQTYGFQSHGRPRKDGSQRFKGPALVGHLRCPNNRTSMNTLHPTKVPTSNCQPGDNCSCSRLITIPGHIAARTRQPKFYGTTEWRLIKNRRNLVESGNSTYRHHHRLDRHAIRVFRDFRTTLHEAMWIPGTLIESAHTWFQRLGTPDPLHAHGPWHPTDPNALIDDPNYCDTCGHTPARQHQHPGPSSGSPGASPP